MMKNAEAVNEQAYVYVVSYLKLALFCTCIFSGVRLAEGHFLCALSLLFIAVAVATLFVYVESHILDYCGPCYAICFVKMQI